MTRIQGAIAANRFGMGARPGEIDAAASDPRGWLKQQVRADAAILSADGLKPVEETLREQREAYRGLIGPDGKPKGTLDAETLQMIKQKAQRDTRDGLMKEVEARSRFTTTTTASFAERWVRFWSNHFTTAAKNVQMIGLVGPFEREAIRPHAFGSFAGLLGNATFHPAMLIYLDANKSIGPSTQAAERRKAGLNENLAREILELHTMGVGSGYTQADIIEFAKALTGWTIGGPQMARLAAAGAGAGRPGLGRPGRFGAGGSDKAALKMAAMKVDEDAGRTVFIDMLHEPGKRTLLGKTYPDSGKQQAAMILDDLALSPATARHVATKLARHFVADQPPASAIEKLQATFIATHGNLSEMARAVIDLDEAWGETAVKFKTPEEMLMSVARASGQDAAFGRDQRTVYTSLAQQPFNAPSPAGWSDDAASWSGADAVMKRLEWSNNVAQRMTAMGSPADFIERALGPTAGERTRLAVSRAESAQQGFTLALMSPEFQRR